MKQSDEKLLDELVNNFSEENAALALAKGGLSHEEFCNHLSEKVARSYLCGTLSFEICDGVMNWLYGYAYVNADRGMPAFAWAVYDAFDEGEYFHEGDDRGTDPPDLHTRPELEVLVARLDEIEKSEDKEDLRDYYRRRFEPTVTFSKILDKADG